MEAEWASKPALLLLIGEKILAPAGIRTLDRPALSLVLTPTTCAIRFSRVYCSLTQAGKSTRPQKGQMCPTADLTENTEGYY
jgi:hypothetical protein